MRNWPLIAAALALGGCMSLPARITVTAPSGVVLAVAAPATGEIRLTEAGMSAIQPKIIFTTGGPNARR